MNTISTKELEKILKNLFPGLKDWNPTDPFYHVVPITEMEELIARFPQPLWLEYKWECEEIAKGWMMDVRRWEYTDSLSTYNRAIGVANTLRIQGHKRNHTVNLVYTDQGVMLIDSATGGYWPAIKGQDNIYFVEM
jgi:hypothetical protein